jgi:hypothetical protein
MQDCVTCYIAHHFVERFPCHFFHHDHHFYCMPYWLLGARLVLLAYPLVADSRYGDLGVHEKKQGMGAQLGNSNGWQGTLVLEHCLCRCLIKSKLPLLVPFFNPLTGCQLKSDAMDGGLS